MSNQNLNASQEALQLFNDAVTLAWVERKPFDAIETLQRAIQLDPNFSAAILEIARICYAQLPDKIELALAAVSSFLEKEPESIQGLRVYANIQLRSRNFESAEQTYRAFNRT